MYIPTIDWWLLSILFESRLVMGSSSVFDVNANRCNYVFRSVFLQTWPPLWHPRRPPSNYIKEKKRRPNKDYTYRPQKASFCLQSPGLQNYTGEKKNTRKFSVGIFRVLFTYVLWHDIILSANNLWHLSFEKLKHTCFGWDFMLFERKLDVFNKGDSSVVISS